MMPFDAQELRAHIDAICARAHPKDSGNQTAVDVAAWLRAQRESWTDATLVQFITELLADDDRDRAGSPARKHRLRRVWLLLAAASELRVRSAFMPEIRRALERLTTPGLDRDWLLGSFDAMNGDRTRPSRQR